MSGNIKKIVLAVLLVVMCLPIAAAAEVDIDFSDPVPIPSNDQFSCGDWTSVVFGCGPAGQFTATGLILSIIGILLAITGILAVLFLIIGGLRYLTAAGNEEQAESAKKTLQHAVLGLVIVILSFVVVRLISNALLFGNV